MKKDLKRWPKLLDETQANDQNNTAKDKVAP